MADDTVVTTSQAHLRQEIRTTRDALMIEINRLTKRFGRVLAADGLTFAVQPGGITGFLGPNGAGKSTTLRMMVGLVTPDAGTALVHGSRYRDLRWPLREVGAVLDTAALHPNRTAGAHLRWLAATHDIPGRRVDEVLDLVGLTGVAGRRAGRFSLGMKQRLGIAAALLGDPHVLLLDEPANGLDPDGIRWLRSLVTGLAADGRAVLLSSHFIGEIATLATHVVVLGRGRLLADAATEELTAGMDSLEDVYFRLTDSSVDYR